LGKKNKVTFLVDTDAGLSVIKRSSLQPGIKYSRKGGINVKGISNRSMKTKDDNTVIIHRHMKPHTIHVVGNEFGIQYDGIYCDQQVIMGEVVVKFYPKPDKTNSEN